MKKMLSSILVMLMVLTVFTCTAFASSQSDGLTVKSISYVPTTVNYRENRDGSQHDGYYVKYNKGDKFTVNYKDGTSETYYYDLFGGRLYEPNGFFTKKGKPLMNEPEISHNQSKNPWKLGENTYTVKYGGCKTTVTVKVVKYVTYNDGTLNYEVNNDGKSLTVTGFEKDISGALSIPSLYKDLPVCEILYDAFKDCTEITSVSIPSTVKTIGDGAFLNCKSLTGVSLSKGLNVLGAEAFGGCKKLKSVKLPSGLTEIHYGAFSGCSDLSSVTIPDSVIEIDGSVFSGTALENNASNWKNGVLYVGNHLIKAKIKKVPESYTIKYGTKVIADNAFAGYYDGKSAVTCSKLKSLTVSSTVVTIGDYAFESCSGLKTVSIPDSVTKIGRYAFGGCSNLTSAKIPESVKSMYGSFYNCKKLTVLCVKDSYAFYRAKKEVLNYKLIPSAVTLSSVSNTSSGVKVSWKAKTGVDSYTVYRKTTSTEWKKLKTTTKTSFTDTTAKSGNKYYYSVSASNKNGNGTKDENGLSKLYLATPTAKSANKNGYINVTWNKITGAKGYAVYKKTGSGEFKKTATVDGGSTVSYKDKSVKSGTKYTYYVRAFNGKTYSSYKKTTALMYLKSVTISSATSKKAGITVKWDKISASKGYYVYRKAGNGSYKKLATVTGAAKVSYLDKSAQKGTTYTYYVKAYNGDFKGCYANTKSCKDKY